MATIPGISSALSSAQRAKSLAVGQVRGALGSAKNLGAGARAALAAAQMAPAELMRDVQRLLEVPDFGFGPSGGASGLSALPGGGSGSPSASRIDITREPLALLGGLTLERVRQMHEAVRDARVTRKNLWFIRVTDPNPPKIGYAFQQGGIGGVIDLLAVEVSYSPFTLTGDKINVGAAVMDRLTGTEAIELSLTTMDDEAGTIKRWFEGKCLQAASPDGTFGLPAEYCVNIDIVHAVSSSDAPVKSAPYKSMMTMRPQAIQFDLSRREAALQELVISFSEFDSFLSAVGGIL